MGLFVLVLLVFFFYFVSCCWLFILFCDESEVGGHKTSGLYLVLPSHSLEYSPSLCTCPFEFSAGLLLICRRVVVL